MPIKSYLVYTEPHEKEEVSYKIAEIKGCEVIPSENKDLIVLVTETENKATDELLLSTIENMKGIAHIAMVSGFNESQIDNNDGR